jgi:hypothetical protein
MLTAWIAGGHWHGSCERKQCRDHRSTGAHSQHLKITGMALVFYCCTSCNFAAEVNVDFATRFFWPPRLQLCHAAPAVQRTHYSAAAAQLHRMTGPSCRRGLREFHGRVGDGAHVPRQNAATRARASSLSGRAPVCVHTVDQRVLMSSIVAAAALLALILPQAFAGSQAAMPGEGAARTSPHEHGKLRGSGVLRTSTRLPRLAMAALTHTARGIPIPHGRVAIEGGVDANTQL